MKYRLKTGTIVYQAPWQEAWIRLPSINYSMSNIQELSSTGSVYSESIGIIDTTLEHEQNVTPRLTECDKEICQDVERKL